PNPSSAYDRLSLGNQKVASALYQAQTPIVGTTARPLSLEQIAAKRRSGQEWGHIFRELKQQGLVHEKTLGQVVARYLRTTDAPSVVSNDSGGHNGDGIGVGKGGRWLRDGIPGRRLRSPWPRGWRPRWSPGSSSPIGRTRARRLLNTLLRRRPRA